MSEEGYNFFSGSQEEINRRLYYLILSSGGTIVVDDVTLVLENGIVSIKNEGVNTTQLHDNAVTYAKLSNDLVVDNLTTDDSTKVLSAKQGKILYDYIGNIEEDMLS